MAFRQPMDVAAMQGLSAVPMRQAAVESSQVYIRGAVLIDVSGEIELAGANPVDIVGIAVAKNPPSNTPQETGQYIPALPMIEMEANIDTSASLGTGVIAQTDLWAHYGVTEDPSGFWYVDKNKAAATDVRVVITRLLDPIGEVQGRVRFQWLQVVNVATAPTTVTRYVAGT